MPVQPEMPAAFGDARGDDDDGVYTRCGRVSGSGNTSLNNNVRIIQSSVPLKPSYRRRHHRYFSTHPLANVIHRDHRLRTYNNNGTQCTNAVVSCARVCNDIYSTL